MKNQNLRLVIFFSIVILLSVMATSCGARKKEKNQQYEKTEQLKKEKTEETTKEESNVKTDVEIKIDSQTGTKTVKTTYEPIDNNKPATVEKNGKKTNLNNAKLTEEETYTNNKTETNGKASTTSESKKEAAKQSEASQKAATKKTADSLNVKRDGWKWNWSWLFWLVVGVFLIWKYGRFDWLQKIKDKILGV